MLLNQVQVAAVDQSAEGIFLGGPAVAELLLLDLSHEQGGGGEERYESNKNFLVHAIGNNDKLSTWLSPYNAAK